MPHPGAPKVPGNAHLQGELVKNEGLGLNAEAKGVCLCHRSHHHSESAPSTSPRTADIFFFLVQKSLVAVRCWLRETPRCIFTKTSSVPVGPAVLNYDPKAVGWEQSIRIPGVVCNVCALASGSERPLSTVPQQVK